MTTPLLQEAAKVLFDSFRQSVPWETLTARQQSEYAEAAQQFARWLLTREPTEAMVEAAAQKLSDISFLSYRAAYRAMNAALLKEVEG